MNLRPFDKSATCPKCGHSVVSVFYKARAEYGRSICCQRAECPSAEHMHRECQQCGYQWPEAPLPEGTLAASDTGGKT